MIPLKTGKIFVYILIIIFATSGIYIKALSAPETGNPQIAAESALLFELEHGQILFRKNVDTRLHVSSVNKLMTSLIALEKVKPYTKILISKNSVNVDGAILNLEVGEKYYIEDLITAVLLTPSNDAANAIAEYVGGDIDNFTALMNDKAKELKMQDTYFKNPTGLLDMEQYTTARDLYTFLRYSLKNPEFVRLYSKKGFPFSNKILTNRNKLFWSYDGVTGGKAGFNEKDKQTAITSAVRENRNLVSIVLYSPQETVWKDSTMLLDFGFKEFRRGRIVKSGDKIRTITVGDTEINLISIADIFYTHPLGDDNIDKVQFFIPDNLKPPILKDKPLGSMKYILKDGTVMDVPLFSDKELLPPKSFISRILSKFSDAKDLLYIVIILLFVEVVLVVKKVIGLINKKRFFQ